MCGIAGIYKKFDTSKDFKVGRALEALINRGPDDKGLWSDNNVSLGHRRLSIRGVSNGHQPLVSFDGNIVAVVNGEFYGVDQIKNDFKGYSFRTDSDSEIVLPLYQKYGIKGMMKYLRGEFAFLLYDSSIQTLYMVRDRFGIKPLCYMVSDTDTLYVASKAKAIFAMGVKPQWDMQSLGQSLSMHYQMTDRTMFRGVKQVEPGHILSFNGDSFEIKDYIYWDMRYPDDNGYKVNTNKDYYIEELRQLMIDCVRDRMVSDVPVCCHLSGGLDSSVVAGVMASLSNKPVDCFSIVFPYASEEYDESKLAKQTVKHIHGKLHKVEISQKDIFNNLSDAVFMTEGLAVNGHLSCKYLLNKSINENGFKVALTGEGADECLCGYPHLRNDLFKSLTENMRKSLETKLYSTNLSIRGTEIPVGNTLDLTYLSNALGGFTPTFLEAKGCIGFKMLEYMTDDMRDFCGQRDYFNDVVWHHDKALYEMKNTHNVYKSLYLWNKLSLCNYILSTLGDGCEMSYAVEGRLPFLDHRLFEFAAKLPLHMKIRGYTNEKYILKEAMKLYITETVYNRQKHPFQSPPLSMYMTQEEIEMITDELNSQSFRNMGIFNSIPAVGLMRNIQSFSIEQQAELEPVYMLMLTIYYMHRMFMTI